MYRKIDTFLELEELKRVHLIKQAKYGTGDTLVDKNKKWEVNVYVNPKLNENNLTVKLQKDREVEH